MVGFAFATLGHVALLMLAALFGGPWVWLALGWITVFAATLDRFVPRLFPDMGDGAQGAEFPTGARLSETLAWAHFVLLPLTLLALTGDTLGGWEKLALFLAVALFFGQVSHPNAHELIHRPEARARALGRWVYITMLFGHHASAHVLVHHVHVGTGADPNSARRGMGFYRFFARAWAGSFQAGLAAETARRDRAGKSRLGHPYLAYTLGAALTLVTSALLFGAWGLLACLSLGIYAQVQILLADYVQHYGLRRTVTDTGKPEPVADSHSWNSPHWFTSALMVNAPRHSDHHLNPARPYPGLRLRNAMPILPYSLPVMAVLALFPPIWRRVMARTLGALAASG